MSFAGANRTGLYRIAEGVMGTIPTAPVMVPLRYTGESIGFNIETVTSNEIRDDRQITDLVNTGQESSGSFDFELSFGAFDDLIEASMFTDYTTAVAVDGTTVTFSNTNGTIADSANGFANVVAGQWIKVIAANDNNNIGFYRVLGTVDGSTDPAQGLVYVSPAPGADEADATTVQISGQMLRNGTSQKSFTIEKFFNDTTPPVHQYFTGMNLNGMSKSFEVGSILTGSFDFMGFGASISTQETAGTTRGASASGQVLNSVTNLQNILIDKGTSGACITSMSLDVANNLRSQKCIGSLASVGIGVGRFEASGSISIFFENLTEYNKFIESTAFSLSMRAEDAAGNAYIYTFPNVKYESMSLNASGTDTDILLEGSYKALYDPSTKCTVQIDRLPQVITDTSVSTVDTIQFALAVSSGGDDTAAPVINIVRTGDGVGAVSVDVQVAGGTAQGGGTDYTYTTQTISWIDGNTDVKPLTGFGVINDADASDETIIFEIVNPVGPGAGIGEITQHTYTITPAA